MDASPAPDRDGAALRDYLAQRDVECPGCGYNLRGLTGARCPECRQPLELRVGLAEPRLGAYLAAVAGLLGGASLAGLFFLTVMVISVAEKGWPRGRESIPLLWLPAVMAITESALLAGAMRARFRVWFRGRTRAGRTAVIAGCWLVTAGFISTFLVLLFRLIW